MVKRKKLLLPKPKFPPTERALKIKAIREEISGLENQIQDLEYEFLREVAYKKGLQAEDLTLGSWSCPDPDNTEHVCVYNDGDEYDNESCVFCGEPSERK